MLSVLVILALIATGLTVASAAGKCPLWAPVFVLCLIVLLQVLPLR